MSTNLRRRTAQKKLHPRNSSTTVKFSFAKSTRLRSGFPLRRQRRRLQSFFYLAAVIAAEAFDFGTSSIETLLTPQNDPSAKKKNQLSCRCRCHVQCVSASAVTTFVVSTIAFPME